MEEMRLPGGNAGGAVLVDGTVRRAGGPWSTTVHALLHHLETKGFGGAPRALGFDSQGREMLSYLPGATVGDDNPWPAWVHSDRALEQVGDWLRRYHLAVTDFIPPEGAHWRMADRPWQPGDVVGHNDAAPYNAVWRTGAGEGALAGFIDWDFAAPCAPIFDLSFVVFSWVPLHARSVVTAEGFTAFAERPRRLRLLLESYEYGGSIRGLLDAVEERIALHVSGIRDLAEAGDPLFQRLIDVGTVDAPNAALAELAQERPALERA